MKKMKNILITAMLVACFATQINVKAQQSVRPQRHLYTCHAASADGQFRFTHINKLAAEHQVMRHCRQETHERHSCHFAGCDPVEAY